MANELKVSYTPKQLPKLVDWFGDNAKSGYRQPRASGITSWALLCGHARPCTHAQAQANAKAIMQHLGYNIESAFNLSSAWHGSPRSKAIVYKPDGPLARYSAAINTPIGNFAMRCTVHGTQRSKCVVECEQGLYNSSTDKWLATMALGVKIDTGKATKPKAQRRPRNQASTPKVDVKPPTPNVDGDNERSAATQASIDALNN